MTVSAYMIAHCDDDFLQAAIASVIDRVDELIFVDGAYAWVAPFFERAGLDPARSWQTTHDILAGFGDKIRYFSGIWDDELHKRSFGYAQCGGDIILRIDADEIFEFDDAAWAAFLKSSKSVAEMEFPYLLRADSQRLDRALTTSPKQCCAFKAAAFRSPLEHCAYLWLVLTEEERARCGKADWSRLFPKPVVNTAHLTALRTPRTAVNRARFYTLQHVRATGQPGWPRHQAPGATPDETIAGIFDFLTPDEYGSWLEGQEIVSGFVHMNGFKVAPHRFSSAVAAQVETALRTQEQAMEALLDFGSHSRLVISEAVSLIDVTSLLRRGMTRFELEFSEPMEQVTGHLYFLLDSDEDQSGINLEPVHCRTEGRCASGVFAPIDMDGVLKACFVMQPIIAPPVTKARLVRLTPGY